jgi:LPXTG-motif cell wall-anchored protein
VRVYWRIAIAGIVSGAFIAAGPDAGAQQALPTIRIEATRAAQLVFNACGFHPPRVDVTPGRVVVSRTGTLNATLRFRYEAKGAKDGSGSVQFAVGARTKAISVIPRTDEPVGHIAVRILPGADYALGSPVVGTVDVGHISDGCAIGPTTSMTTSTTTSTVPVLQRDLPRTGSNHATMALLGGTLVSAGGGLLAMRRGRRAHRRT